MEPYLAPHIHKYLRQSRLRGGEAVPHHARLPKTYPRMLQIALPDFPPLTMSVADALQKRANTLIETPRPLSLSDISQLLGHALKITERGRRPYPSGGGYYPIEVYALTFSVESLERAAYHYRPDTHALEQLWNIEQATTPAQLTPQDIGTPSLFLVLTANCQKSQRKYNDFSYALALFEAGHIMQNITLTGAAMRRSIRPLGGFLDNNICEILDLPATELPLYAAAM